MLSPVLKGKPSVLHLLRYPEGLAVHTGPTAKYRRQPHTGNISTILSQHIFSVCVIATFSQIIFMAAICNFSGRIPESCPGTFLKNLFSLQLPLSILFPMFIFSFIYRSFSLLAFTALFFVACKKQNGVPRAEAGGRDIAYISYEGKNFLFTDRAWMWNEFKGINLNHRNATHLERGVTEANTGKKVDRFTCSMAPHNRLSLLPFWGTLVFEALTGSALIDTVYSLSSFIEVQGMRRRIYKVLPDEKQGRMVCTRSAVYAEAGLLVTYFDENLALRNTRMKVLIDKKITH